MILESGELDTRLTIQQKSKAKDEIGEYKDKWVDVGTFWGSLKPLTKSNANLAKGFEATVSYETKLRYCEAVNNGCRVIAFDKFYYVNGVIQDPQRVWTQLFLTREEK